jgi:hypothetical protein
MDYCSMLLNRALSPSCSSCNSASDCVRIDPILQEFTHTNRHVINYSIQFLDGITSIHQSTWQLLSLRLTHASFWTEQFAAGAEDMESHSSSS